MTANEIGAFTTWVEHFEAHTQQRSEQGDPPWAIAAHLDRSVVRSLQRFQIGEEGDGARLLAKAASAGDPSYLAAARLFVAEEREHARLLKLLLASAGQPTLTSHWSDNVFMAVRRALGLQLELMTLMLAEVVALRYYRAVRDGTDDALLTEVGRRILADEERHVPFHCQRLRLGFQHLPRVGKRAAAGAWWILLLGAVTVVALDHGPALHRLGVGRVRFILDIAGLFRGVIADVFGYTRPDKTTLTRSRLRSHTPL